jgi:ubiquinol-cytochrome c reductase cytochrome b subunit
LAKTYLLAGYFSFPTSANPLSYLGFLAFICFILLGFTGLLLQLYYVPEPGASYDSVMKINNAIPYGFELRNLHYWLANFFIVLAVAHLFYLYFLRKYRLKNEVLWVTGILVGVLTILAAYTGYVLIMNQRAMMALEIGSGILRGVHPTLSSLLTGVSLADTLLRMYTLHVVVIPAIMVALFIVHFPRKLTVDVPVISAMVGAAFVVGGLIPVDLGSRFVQSYAYYRAQFIVPEWYLTAMYAILRTGVQVFIATVLLPFTFIFTFILIPFFDRGARLGAKGRVLQIAIGLIAIAHISLTTIWGFRGRNFFDPIKWAADLPIDPEFFYSFLLSTAILILCATAFAFGAARMLSGQKWCLKAFSLTRMRKVGHRVSESISLPLMFLVLLLQFDLYVDLPPLKSLSFSGLAMTESGLSILGFAAVTYLYRRR